MACTSSCAARARASRGARSPGPPRAEARRARRLGAQGRAHPERALDRHRRARSARSRLAPRTSNRRGSSRYRSRRSNPHGEVGHHGALPLRADLVDRDRSRAPWNASPDAARVGPARQQRRPPTRGRCALSRRWTVTTSAWACSTRRSPSPTASARRPRRLGCEPRLPRALPVPPLAGPLCVNATLSRPSRRDCPRLCSHRRPPGGAAPRRDRDDARSRPRARARRRRACARSRDAIASAARAWWPLLSQRSAVTRPAEQSPVREPPPG